MKNIGIITFHRALNYGALLQAFALKHSLQSMGAQAYVMDYRNPIIEEMYFYPSFSQRKSIKAKLKYIIQGRNETERRVKFDNFREKYLNLTQMTYTPGNISEASELCDIFVTGSDQVWNCGAHNFDKNYLLDFVRDRHKKFSYAASFGISELPDKYTAEYKRLLDEFEMCSVREKSGIHILEKLGIENCRLDLDPTMLLTSDEWQKQLGIEPQPQKYIFAYYFELTDTLKAYIERLASENDCTVLYLGNAFKSPFNCKSKAIKTADPIDFVRAVANAKYVVTNSFHGTAFSIIFNKPFYVELLKTDAKVNSRIENVLQTFSLESRIIGGKNENADVDWSGVNDKMTELRNISLQYLRGLSDD